MAMSSPSGECPSVSVVASSLITSPRSSETGANRPSFPAVGRAIRVRFGTSDADPR